VPITNAQYHLFLKNTEGRIAPAPINWEGDRPPKRLEGHPVVNVTWYVHQYNYL
jgi:formylglycine-generating enzyme required for sulfatase activity